jgi:hypothetical protein
MSVADSASLANPFQRRAMRLLFSATPAYGRVLPLSALIDAAVEAGHDAALLTSLGFQAKAVAELPPQ